MTYLVLGLPRSRTAWLSRFLTYGEWYCGHEELRHLRSLDDVAAWFSQPCTGSAETAAAPWWRLIPQDVRIVTVRRPVADVIESLMALPGLSFDRDALTKLMAYHDRKLDQIEARRDVLSVTFDDLNNEETCKRVFEHCTLLAHDPAHWARLAPVNVQCHMVAMMRHYQAFPLDSLARTARHKIMAQLSAREPVVDGMTFQTEDFDTWLADAGPLFDDHLIQVGEAPGDWQNKNIPLMRRIHDAGAMQIMTARSNGRMFGYLMTLIAPSLVGEDVVSATNTTFYASPDAPGTGLKLQRAALAELKRRGVDHVVWEAGQRGSGPRLGAMYRRLGAREHGQMFRLDLAGV